MEHLSFMQFFVICMLANETLVFVKLRKSKNFLKLQFKLVFNKKVIGPFFFCQLFMSARFNYFSFLNHNDLVGIFYRAEPVSHHYYGPPHEELLEIFQDYLFIVCIRAFVASSKKIYAGSLYTALAISNRCICP